MRTFVLILMLALLPLRMWAAEDMAVRMALDQPAGTVSATGAMPEDCPMMAQHKGHAEDGTGEGSPSSAHCLTCQLCGAAACPSEVALQSGPAPAGPTQSGASRYLSVQLAPDLRPPIS